MPSLPHVVSSLFRGHQVLGDRAPEFPPDPAQQNTLFSHFPHNCLSVRTSLDQALAITEEGTPETISWDLSRLQPKKLNSDFIPQKSPNFP